jgi:hypothetical protein
MSAKCLSQRQAFCFPGIAFSPRAPENPAMTSLPPPVSLALVLSATLSAVVVLWAPAAQAQQVYRCEQPDGRVAYSDAPCPRSARQAQVDVAPNTVDTSADREVMLRQENERLREQLRREQAAASRPAPVVVQNAVPADRVHTPECRKAQEAYETSASSISNTEAFIDAKRSAMFAACGLAEPDRTVAAPAPVIVVPPHGRPPVRPQPRPQPQVDKCPSGPGDLRNCGIVNARARAAAQGKPPPPF